MIALKKLALIYNYRCCYCGKKFNIDELSREHVEPRSRNGNGKKANIRLSCKVCNKEHGDMPSYLKAHFINICSNKLNKQNYEANRERNRNNQILSR